MNSLRPLSNIGPAPLGPRVSLPHVGRRVLGQFRIVLKRTRGPAWTTATAKRKATPAFATMSDLGADGALKKCCRLWHRHLALEVGPIGRHVAHGRDVARP